MEGRIRGRLVLVVALSLAGVLAQCVSYAYTGEVSRDFDSPSRYATGLTWDGKHLWICDWMEAKAFEVEPGSGKPVGSLELPCGNPEDIVYADGFFFVCSGAGPLIYKFDPESGEVVTTFPGPESSPSALAWDGKNLWLADRGTAMIYKLDPSDGTTIDYFPSPSPQIEAMAWDGRYLWAADRTRDELYMLSAEDGTVIIVADSPGPYPSGLAFDGKWLWNVDFQNDTLYRLNYDDGERVYTTDSREREVTFMHRITNLGPGTLTSLDVLLAVAEDSIPGQVLVRPMTFEPEPTRFATDKWGQKVAIFEFRGVGPGETRQAAYTARAVIGNRRFSIFPHRVGKLGDIPPAVRKAYTSDESRYRITQPLISETARKIVGDEKNPYWMARKICKWVQDHVEYKRVGGWDIAETLIKRGTGSCSEYSFLYIALCRAVGLPARYEGSIAVRGDDASIDEVYHRWCEVYLPGYGWIPVDPSGGDRPLPSEQAKAFGSLPGRYFITTHGGGDSEYLGWSYNHNSRYSFKGRVEVKEEAFGVWEPVEQKE
ncbi:MAG: transglutaminase domain-containing protein [Candidatus Eisenbacteria bacterium]